MQITLVNKKHFITASLLVIAILITLGLIYYRHRQIQWQEYKRQVEGQKAEEITIRIIEGWSNREIGQYLEKEGIVGATDFLKSVKNFDSSKHSFLPPEAKGDLQGFLYPDSYRLFKSLADRAITIGDQASKTIIAKLLDTFEKRLPDNAGQLAKKQGLTLYQSVILASIIENETGRDAATAESKAKLEAERRIVAGIFYNRLKANMALQSDATINYITGKNDPAPLLADLEIKSPYNTYKNRGLPPTPIGNPSLSSINAALNPANTDYFYFLHKQPTGEPVYSKTFGEHVANKLKYLK
ncbi:MAG: endolytic transglycosylase MltG [Patescibacteria group bacterium]